MHFSTEITAAQEWARFMHSPIWLPPKLKKKNTLCIVYNKVRRSFHSFWKSILESQVFYYILKRGLHLLVRRKKYSKKKTQKQSVSYNKSGFEEILYKQYRI